MTWNRRRTVLAIAVCAVALAAAGAIAVGASLSDPEPVDTLSTARLGSTFTTLEHIDQLPAVPNTAGAALAADPRLGVPDADVGPARKLASFGSAGLIIMPGDGGSTRVCMMTTGHRFLVQCLDKEQLGNGRVVFPTPLVAETAETTMTVPRVDFIVVPDEVVGVVTDDGPAKIEGNVAIAERPHGGPMGSVEYELKDGRRVKVAFASVSP